MENKFKNVPIDKDTTILFEAPMKFDQEDILYQKWYWDNIYGESIIFTAEDIKHMSDDELKKYIASSDIIKDKNSITISRNKSGYTFVNFNFMAE